MDLTSSFTGAIPPEILERYEWTETRRAAAVMRAAALGEFEELLRVLGSFRLDEARDILARGGNESQTAAVLNKGFRELGWREGEYHETLKTSVKLKPYATAGETLGTQKETIAGTASYAIDNLKGGVALDVEWHAKDGNLDRDLAAYRSLYDSGAISMAVMITKVRKGLRQLALSLDPTSTKFTTSTTTSLEKVIPRLVRGDAGGCPVLVVAISRNTA